MNDGRRYTIRSPILSNLPPTRPTLPAPLLPIVGSTRYPHRPLAPAVYTPAFSWRLGARCCRSRWLAGQIYGLLFLVAPGGLPVLCSWTTLAAHLLRQQRPSVAQRLSAGFAPGLVFYGLVGAVHAVHAVARLLGYLPILLVYFPLGFPAFRTLFPEMFVRLSVGGYGCSVARLWPGLVGRFGELRIGTVLGGSCRWLGARAIFRLLSCGTAASGVSQEVGPVLLAPGLTVYGGLGAVAAQAHGLGLRALFLGPCTISLLLGLGAEWGPLRRRVFRRCPFLGSGFYRSRLLLFRIPLGKIDSICEKLWFYILHPSPSRERGIK